MTNAEYKKQLLDLIKHHPGYETKPMYKAVMEQVKRLSDYTQLKLF